MFHPTGRLWDPLARSMQSPRSHCLLFDLGRKPVARGQATTHTRRDDDGNPRMRRKPPKRAPLKPPRALLSFPFSLETGGSACSRAMHFRLKATVSQYPSYFPFSVRPVITWSYSAATHTSTLLCLCFTCSFAGLRASLLASRFLSQRPATST